MRLDVNKVNEIFQLALSSTITPVPLLIDISDSCLKRHTVVGFFTPESKEELYRYIYMTKTDQELKLDLIYAVYNALIAQGITKEEILDLENEYSAFITGSGISPNLKQMYVGTVNGVDDILICVLFFMRIYLEHYDNNVFVISNKQKRV